MTRYDQTMYDHGFRYEMTLYMGRDGLRLPYEHDRLLLRSSEFYEDMRAYLPKLHTVSVRILRGGEG